MSFIGDVLGAFEADLRTIIPTLPFGAAGVERGWRPSDQLPPGERPHVFLYNESETAEKLIARQLRMTASITGLIVRHGSTHDQALADYDAIVSLIDSATAFIHAGVDDCEVTLDGIETEHDSKVIATAFTLTARKVWP